MALNFKIYEPKESGLVELGTVASQIPGGKISFTRGSLAKYYAGVIKAISITFLNKKGESDTAPLSKRVSTTVKRALENGATKEDCLNAIAKLLVLETKDGTNVICAPRGEDNDEVEVAIAVATKSAVSYQELASW